VLALVTARGGSKRVPGKNLRPLGGRPLIEWTLHAARDLPGVSDVLVSTDDDEIAALARKAGALVPWLRPAELASDTAGSVGVCLHALDWYEPERGALDGLLLLQPTSPFRRRETLVRAIGLFGDRQRRPVVSVSPAESHPMWCFRVTDGVLQPFHDASGLAMRSQDLPPAYVLNGAVYLISPRDLRARRSFLGGDVVPLIMQDRRESLDIDSEWDWKVAELLLATDPATLR
jgi:N-acylneuraminate cytidylyltransferase